MASPPQWHHPDDLLSVTRVTYLIALLVEKRLHPTFLHRSKGSPDIRDYLTRKAKEDENNVLNRRSLSCNKKEVLNQHWFCTSTNIARTSTSWLTNGPFSRSYWLCDDHVRDHVVTSDSQNHALQMDLLFSQSFFLLVFSRLGGYPEILARWCMRQFHLQGLHCSQCRLKWRSGGTKQLHGGHLRVLRRLTGVMQAASSCHSVMNFSNIYKSDGCKLWLRTNAMPFYPVFEVVQQAQSSLYYLIVYTYMALMCFVKLILSTSSWNILQHW